MILQDSDHGFEVMCEQISESTSTIAMDTTPIMPARREPELKIGSTHSNIFKTHRRAVAYTITTL